MDTVGLTTAFVQQVRTFTATGSGTVSGKPQGRQRVVFLQLCGLPEKCTGNPAFVVSLFFFPHR